MTSKPSKNAVMLSPVDLERVLGSTMDAKWQDVLSLGFDGKINEACELAAILLAKSTHLLMPPMTEDKEIDLEIIDGLIGTLSNLAICNGGMSEAMVGLYCQAVDMGFYAYAYNAANGIFKRAQTPDDFCRAQAYFKISIATETDPSLKGAALINYCPIIRDGLITGEPDLEGALSLYRQAANLGLITGMFNYANVCAWQISNHDTQHADEGAMWLRKVLKIIAEGRELLEMDDPENVASIHEHAHHLLARFNIDGVLSNSSFDEGVALLKRSIMLSTRDLPRKRWNLECAYAHKLMTLSVEKVISIHPWYDVLHAIDWMPTRPHRLVGFEAEVMQVGDGDKCLPFVVMDQLFYPDALYKTLAELDRYMQSVGFMRYFIVSSYALHKSVGDREVVPLVIMASGARYLAGLNLEETPANQLEACIGGREFSDCINRLTTSIVALSVNVLNEKSTMTPEVLPNSRYIVLEKDWKLPFFKKEPFIDLME